MEWEQPHWSGRPERKQPPRRKLRPNGFARIARIAVLNRHLVLGAAIVLAVVCGGLAAATLRIDPDAGPRVTLDDATTALQADLDRHFPNIEQTFMAIVESREAETAKAQAMALSSSLRQRPDLFTQSFVPGTGPFYETNALLFASAEDVKARVDAVLQMQPLYQALAAAPDIMGLSSLVAEISKSVEQGRSPAGLEALLFAAAATVEAEVRGNPRPIDWPALAGLKGEAHSLRWFVLATPKSGVEVEAAEFARRSSDGMQGVAWLWPRRTFAGQVSPLRDFIVPGGLSVFMLLALLAAGLGSFRQTAALMLCGGVTLSISAAAAAAAGRVLDGATWPFAAAALAPVLVMGTALALAHDHARRRGLSSMQSAMLAAQQQGGMISVMAFIFAAFWLSWVVRQLPSLSQFSVLALIGTAAAWITVTVLLPAATALFERSEPAAERHWLDEALVDQGSIHRRNMLDILSMLIVAAAVFSTVFLPVVRFGERELPSAPAPFLDTPDARGAVHVLAKPEEADALVKSLANLPEVGAIRTIAQFMPPDVPRKLAELHRLGSFVASDPVARNPPDDMALQQSLAELQQRLTAIAAGPTTSGGLRDGALRLRHAISLLADSEGFNQARVAQLEQAMFAGLGDLSGISTGLAAASEPRFADISPDLLRRFVAADGTWRIEVMPKPGIGSLSFAAALRRIVPAAAGEPIASLVRNEIIHHETLLALSMAAVAASILVLAALRNLAASIVALAPVAGFVTLTAAASALLDFTLNSAMLAGASIAAAVLLSATIIATQGTPDPDNRSFSNPVWSLRAALVSPLALAGAVAPLAISSRPVFSDLGVFLAGMLFLAALLCFLLVPSLQRWLASLTGRTPTAPEQS